MMRQKKVIIALSGGTDSSVAAALLKRAGADELRSSSRFANARLFDLIGVFMKLADFPQFRETKKRAERVAKILGIPFLVLDLRKEFKKRIISRFLKEYKLGKTPNPCVFCNKEIKFGLLLEKALALGANFIATGHYARLKRKRSGVCLLKGKDKEKDQSYFLWRLNQKQLKHILFPVGDYTKEQVRSLAKKFKLPVLKIPESQEICFIRNNINNFLKRNLKNKPGKIITKEGKIVGEHGGLWFYTIGQRKGIKLPGGPYWVLDKHLKKNLLIVTKNENDLFKKELLVKNINWISGKEPKLPLKVKAKIRYRHQPALSTITKELKAKTYKVVFKKPQRAITPGQSVVFYRDKELLGGGIIC